ncbi:hypothetical protein JCM10207_009090 [Rhodosporidiobolus poonsookiae]
MRDSTTLLHNYYSKHRRTTDRTCSTSLSTVDFSSRRLCVAQNVGDKWLNPLGGGSESSKAKEEATRARLKRRLSEMAKDEEGEKDGEEKGKEAEDQTEEDASGSPPKKGKPLLHDLTEHPADASMLCDSPCDASPSSAPPPLHAEKDRLFRRASLPDASLPAAPSTLLDTAALPTPADTPVEPSPPIAASASLPKSASCRSLSLPLSSCSSTSSVPSSLSTTRRARTLPPPLPPLSSLAPSFAPPSPGTDMPFQMPGLVPRARASGAVQSARTPEPVPMAEQGRRPYPSPEASPAPFRALGEEEHKPRAVLKRDGDSDGSDDAEADADDEMDVDDEREETVSKKEEPDIDVEEEQEDDDKALLFKAHLRAQIKAAAIWADAEPVKSAKAFKVEEEEEKEETVKIELDHEQDDDEPTKPNVKRETAQEERKPLCAGAVGLVKLAPTTAVAPSLYDAETETDDDETDDDDDSGPLVRPDGSDTEEDPASASEAEDAPPLPPPRRLALPPIAAAAFVDSTTPLSSPPPLSAALPSKPAFHAPLPAGLPRRPPSPLGRWTLLVDDFGGYWREREARR